MKDLRKLQDWLNLRVLLLQRLYTGLYTVPMEQIFITILCATD